MDYSQYVVLENTKENNNIKMRMDQSSEREKWEDFFRSCDPSTPKRQTIHIDSNTVILQQIRSHNDYDPTLSGTIQNGVNTTFLETFLKLRKCSSAT